MKSTKMLFLLVTLALSITTIMGMQRTQEQLQASLNELTELTQDIKALHIKNSKLEARQHDQSLRNDYDSFIEELRIKYTGQVNIKKTGNNLARLRAYKAKVTQTLRDLQTPETPTHPIQTASFSSSSNDTEPNNHAIHAATYRPSNHPKHSNQVVFEGEEESDESDESDEEQTPNYCSSLCSSLCYGAFDLLIPDFLRLACHALTLSRHDFNLLMGASCSDIQKVARSIACGADVNVRSTRGVTALMLTIPDEDFEIATLLIKHGADVNARAHQGTTALILAADFNKESIVTLLLNKRAEIDTQDKYGWTALMFASKKGFANIVKLLLARKADPTIRNYPGCINRLHGRTALEIAKKEKHDEIVRLLSEGTR